MGGLLDNRKARTPSGALLELSAMSNEKNLLHRELTRWKRRHQEIRRRLAEIAAKERRLLAVVQGGEMALGVVTPSETSDPAAEADLQALGLPSPPSLTHVPIDVVNRFKVQELSY